MNLFKRINIAIKSVDQLSINWKKRARKNIVNQKLVFMITLGSNTLNSNEYPFNWTYTAKISQFCCFLRSNGGTLPIQFSTLHSATSAAPRASSPTSGPASLTTSVGGCPEATGASSRPHRSTSVATLVVTWRSKYWLVCFSLLSLISPRTY